MTSKAAASSTSPSDHEPSPEEDEELDEILDELPHLRETRPEFHQVYAQLNGHATCQVDPEGTIVQVNTVMPRFLDIPPEELTGSRFLDFFPSQDHPRIAPLLEEPPKRPIHVQDLKISGKGEKSFSVDLTIVPVHDEKAGTTSTFVMIRDREQPPATVDDSFVYREILDNVVDSVVMTDPEGSLLFWNQAAERLFGWKRNEIIGRNALKLLFLQDDPSAREIISHLRNGDPWRGDCLMKRKDESLFLADFYGGPVLGHDKSVIGTFVVCHDRPSDLETRETQWKQGKMRPGEREALLGRSLDRARLVHEGVQDVKNPLTAMRIQLHILKEALPDAHSERIDHAVSSLERNLQRTSRLLEKMLDMVRIERHRMQLKPESTHLDDLLIDIKHDLRHVAREAGVRIVTDVDPTLRMYGDVRRLAQVITTILSNGVNYTPPGGAVRVTADEKPGRLEIAVQDEGVGLTAEEIQKVFQPFPEMETPSRKPNGTGLSLYIAKGIIEAHRGRLLSESRGRDKGTRFTIILPSKDSVQAIS